MRRKIYELSCDITSDELARVAKKIKRAMKFNKKFYENQEFRKGKKT